MQYAELLGCLAYSRCGRDRGRPFIIVKSVNNRMVMVADGDLRTVENPKLKNLKHLQVTKRVATDLLDIITGGGSLSNTQVRRSLQILLDNCELREGGLEDG